MRPTGKPTGWKKVHVFVSSTFEDMHAERDYLCKKVFPELAEWCERRRLRLVDIDLRWGVTEQDATRNRNAVKVCLERIDDCRPFFLCLLGQRRGWVPREDEVSPETFERFPELRKAIGSASMTELEILHAILAPMHGGIPDDPKEPAARYRPAEHAFFYRRDPSCLGDIPCDPPLLRAIYSDGETPEDASCRRDEPAARPPGERADEVRRYRARWDTRAATPEIGIPLACPSADPAGERRWRDRWRSAGIEAAGREIPLADRHRAAECNRRLTRGRFGSFACDGRELREVILEDLKKAICAEHPEAVEEAAPPGELERELAQQEDFLRGNEEGFIEREGDFAELDRYLAGNPGQMLVLSAPGGSGKSMLLARWIDRLRRSGGGPALLYRFIGRSDRSGTVSGLLRSLLLELARSSGVDGDAAPEIPHDPARLANLWKRRVSAMGQEDDVVIVLDALDQLDTGLAETGWLPSNGLPPKVRLVVSLREDADGAGDLLDGWAGDPHVRIVGLRPFDSLEDRRRLVRGYLSGYLKELDDVHREEVIRLPGSANPLFLKVVLSELRIFGSFSGLGEKIRHDFGDSPATAFEGLLRRLERDPAYSGLPPDRSVPFLFGPLAHSRRGLSADEVASLLLQGLGLPGTEDRRTAALDTVHLLLRQVRPFLARRDGRHDFLFESFRTAARNRYASGGTEECPGAPRREEDSGVMPAERRTAVEWHRLLARHFGGLPLWEDEALRRPRLRRVAELPYHQTLGELWDEAADTLCDLRFLDAACAAGAVSDLQEDFGRLLERLPERSDAVAADRERKRETDRWTREIVEHARAWSERRDRIAGGAAPPGPEPRPPHPPATDRIRSDEEIEAECDRIIRRPERVDRLAAFAAFVAGQSQALAEHGKRPGFVFQQAFNSASGGPVRERATEALGALETPWMELRQEGEEYNPRPACLRVRWMKTASAVGGLQATMASDGSRAVVRAFGSPGLQVWDLGSGESLRVLEERTGFTDCVAVTADGRRAVSGSRDGTLRVWNLDTGSLLRVLQGHVAGVACVAVTADGRRAVSGSHDGTLRVWDPERNECLRILQEDTARTDRRERGRDLHVRWNDKTGVACVAVTPDGRRAVSGSHDGTLRVWDPERGECLRVLQGHAAGVACVAVTPDGCRAVSGGRDRMVRAWEMERGACLRTLEGHWNDIRCVAVTPDGRLAFSASDDMTLRAWDLAGGTSRRFPHNARPAGIVRRRRRPQGPAPESIEDVPPVKADIRDPVGRYIFRSGAGGRLSVYRKASGGIAIPKDAGTECTAADLAAERRRAVTAWNDGTLRIFDLEGRRLLKEIRMMCGAGLLRVTRDGQRAACLHTDGILRIWDLGHGRCVEVPDDGRQGFRDLVVLEGDRRFASTGRSAGILQVRDMDTGACLALFHYDSALASLRRSDDGGILIRTERGEELTLLPRNLP